MSGLVFYYHNPEQAHPAFTVLKSAIQMNGEHRLTYEFNEFVVDAYVLADSPTSRIIAIDFDNTITADVDFYLDLIDAYRVAGWEPVVCTYVMIWMKILRKFMLSYMILGLEYTPLTVRKNALTCCMKGLVWDCGLMIIFPLLLYVAALFSLKMV